MGRSRLVEEDRMHKITAAGPVLAGLLALSMATANADCSYPKAPSNFPDGATATQEQMLEARNAFTAYNDKVTAYLSCLETETNARIEAAGPQAPPEQIEQIKAIYNKRHNAAVDELEANAARFNEQVKVYKARDSKDRKKTSSLSGFGQFLAGHIEQLT
jgi:hypothetical protein